MRRCWPAALALVGTGLLSACSTDRPKPTPLAPLTARASAQALWSVNIGSLGFALSPAARDGRLYVASGAEVRALQLDSGAEVWRAAVGDPVVAGVGSDGRVAAVVTRANEVVALEAGRVLWRQRVPASVVTPPLVAGERVFVMSVDRVVHAFDALDGRRLWVYSKPGDALTLAQAGVLGAYRNTLVVGQGQRLVGLDPVRGSVQWETPMASPRGTNEVERLADLLGPAARVGDRLCVRAFQSAVGCADASRGAVLWSRNVGGVQPVAADAERVFGADASDRITAWRADTGDVAWNNEKLLYRGLSGAATIGGQVVFGDSEGIVHFLSAQDGQAQLRLSTDGKPVLGAPLLTGQTLIVTTQGGGIHAFRPN